MMISKGHVMLRDAPIPGDRNFVKKEAEKILKYTRHHNLNSAHVECESECDAGNNGGDWNHFKITRTVPVQHKWRERCQGTTANSHTGHCTHTAYSADVKVQDIFHGRNNITCGTN